MRPSLCSIYWLSSRILFPNLTPLIHSYGVGSAVDAMPESEDTDPALIKNRYHLENSPNYTRAAKISSTRIAAKSRTLVLQMYVVRLARAEAVEEMRR